MIIHFPGEVTAFEDAKVFSSLKAKQLNRALVIIVSLSSHAQSC
jgi:hypothetical protein